MKFKITPKLLTLGILLVLIPSLIIGIVGYNAAQKAVYDGVNDRLMDQAKDWKLLVDAYDTEIIAQEARVTKSANAIVTAQAKMTYELIDEALKQNDGVLTGEAKEDIFNRLNRNTVGQSGYIWILDYDGNYVLSKGRQRDGENIWAAKDSDGNFMVQDIVRIGRETSGSRIVYHSYPWLNLGETEPREKISAMVHFPELGWIVGISTYYDDLVDMKYRERTVEHVKELMAQQVIGATGYIWVVDSEGNYVVSKNRLRDGENINEAKDAEGVLFIQEAVRKAKDSPNGGTNQVYPWINIGEKNSRDKVAGLSYNKNWDWVIGVSTYYDDFAQQGSSLKAVKNTLLVVGFIAVIIGAFAALFVGLKIANPINRLTKTANKLNEGNLDVTVDVVSNDEIGELAGSMEGLVMGFKMLKKQQEESTKKKK